MSLTFNGATSDRIVSPAGTVDPTAFSMGGWYYCTTRTNGRCLASHRQVAGTTTAALFGISGTSGDLIAQYFRSTTDATSVSNTTPLALNGWTFLFAVFDEGAGSICKIYVGTPGVAAAEVGYASQANGTGTFSTVADGFVFGNRIGAGSYVNAFPGDLGPQAAFSKALTLAEVIALQKRFWPLSNCECLYPLSLDGTAATQTDRSGAGHNGTLTGTVLNAGNNPPVMSPGAFAALMGE